MVRGNLSGADLSSALLNDAYLGDTNLLCFIWLPHY